MDTYILIFSLIFKSGYAGMGGIESIEVIGYDKCKRIGTEWSVSIREKHRANENEVIYTCIKY